MRKTNQSSASKGGKKTCPVCGAVVFTATTDAQSAYPFCSPRCRDVDLSRWFSERYTVPVETERVLNEAAENLRDEEELEDEE